MPAKPKAPYPFVPHTLEPTSPGTRCTTCGRAWKTQPADPDAPRCPGVPVYQWQPWPADLHTARQIADAGRIPGAVRGVIWHSRSTDGVLPLYRMDEATPKPPLSPARAAGIAKAKQTSRAARTCTVCSDVVSRRSDLADHMCRLCFTRNMLVVRRDAAIAWARRILTQDAVVIAVDTSTHDETMHDEIINVSVTSVTGQVLLTTYARPLRSGFIDWNGFPLDALADAPQWSSVAADLYPLLHNRQVIAWDDLFVRRMISRSCCMRRMPSVDAGEWHDLASYYAEYKQAYNWDKDKYDYLDATLSQAHFVMVPADRLPQTANANTARIVALIRALAAQPTTDMTGDQS
jgi:hypothetical protein